MRERIDQFCRREEGGMFRLLQDLVLQPSFSRFKQGVDAVGARLAASLETSGMELETVRQSEFGDHLLFRTPACRDGRPALLLFGHMDTVFPLDSPFNWYKDQDGTVSGPGVIDMKGGLVAAVYTIKALAECELLADIPLTLLCNSDEEIGSPSSTTIFQAEAGRSLAALGFECGGLGGEVVTGRKGRSGYRLIVTGRAGHAASAGADKASAILELAHKVIALEGLNDPGRGIVVNVGVIDGGIGPNTVSDHAVAEIDTRFLTRADAEATAARMAGIASHSTVAGTTAALQYVGGRPPMEQNSRNSGLYQLIRAEADKLHLPCVEELRSGVSDANTIAQLDIPVVDGMGPIGDGDHSDREYMLRQSLPDRVRLAACSILSIRERGFGSG
ncbi:M20 family metallopeptidase [Desulfoprunum benzoelyticum]|nr:M20 family metallopeptidase [Desulfoprunum benzoelyticum]MBM9530885.1 M20 family metallopeptidase [Desulfoprunum benzoelyticum]